MNILSFHPSAAGLHGLTHAVLNLFVHRVSVTQTANRPRLLSRGATFWVPDPRARSIRCLQGTLWLTVDGCPKDFILEVGESHIPDSDRPLAIHALADSQYVLS